MNNIDNDIKTAKHNLKKKKYKHVCLLLTGINSFANIFQFYAKILFF